MSMEVNSVSIAITAFIVLAILIVFFRALPSKNPSLQASYLVSLGMFGTFLGITIALLDFKPANVQASVPNLLGGMQIAFISSAVGIFLSLILRWKSVMNKAVEVAEGKTADDIFSVLESHTDLLASLKTALVGDGDTTLITQLRLLRNESRDYATQINASLNDFAQTLAENNSEAFIKALEGAVREFNEKISEQFGENFARLNDAVGSLLEWQEQYRVQLGEMVNAFSEIDTRFRSASSTLEDVASQTEVFANVSEQQSKWLDVQIATQEELEARLAAFAELGAQAQSAFPIINRNLEEITTGVERTVRDTLATIEGAVEHLENGVGDTQAQVRTLTEGLSQEVTTSVASFQQQLLEANARSRQRLEESIEDLDRMLGEELSKSLGSLGNQLATLSHRFVDDYEPLTERLREIIEITKAA